MNSYKLKKQIDLQTTYVPIEETEAIEQLLRFFCNCDIQLTAWQNRSQQNRFVMPMNMISLNSQAGEFRIVPTQPGTDLTPFKESKKIFLHAHYQHFVCQTNIISYASDGLIVQTPSLVYTGDNRGKKRRRLYGDSCRVRFTKQNNNHEYPILDISEGGLSFKVPIGPAAFFNYKDDEIRIYQMGKDSLDEQLRASIVYITRHEEDMRYRVGVRFHENYDFEQNL